MRPSSSGYVCCAEAFKSLDEPVTRHLPHRVVRFVQFVKLRGLSGHDFDANVYARPPKAKISVIRALAVFAPTALSNGG